MINLFGIQIDTLTTILLTMTLVIIGIVTLLALGNALFFKIGVRNISRRRMQMLLIIFALMLSTTLLSSVLATGDVINGAVQSVAIYNLGNVDETIEGGHGDLGSFSQDVYFHVRQETSQDKNIAAVGAALVEHDLLIADQTSRQVRSKVTVLAVVPGSEDGFGGMQNVNGKSRLHIADLHQNELYLNQTVATLLNAHTGDRVYLYSKRWPGKRYAFLIRAIVVNGGLVGETPSILTQAESFRTIENQPGAITKIFIANQGGGGVNGVGLTDMVTQKLQRIIPNDVHVNQVKQQGVQVSQNAENLFSRVFALFCLFALAIGLLLIFLIFVLLAAERRAEMGMARAIGVQRRHLILMFLFEGTVYDLLASLVGLAFGVGVGALLVIFLGPMLVRFNFPLSLTFQPHSLIIAYCLGVIFTFCSVAISAWLVSRMTVVEAMRDLPEPSRQSMSLGESCVRLIELFWLVIISLASVLPARHARQSSAENIPARPAKVEVNYSRSSLKKIWHTLFEQIPDTLVGLIRQLILLGFLPLLAGYWLMQIGLQDTQIAFFSLGLSMIVLGGGLLLRTAWSFLAASINMSTHRGNAQYSQPDHRKQTTGLFAAGAGMLITIYWAFPFDVLARLGLPRFHGGIEIFFLAGFMMVLGTTWALVANAGWVVGPLVALCADIPGLNLMARLASAYPLHRRFRTGLSVIMFSLVVFAMTVMAIITNAMQNTYSNIDTQTGGYDIQAVAYFQPLQNINSTLLAHGVDPHQFASIGTRTSTAVGVIQLSAQNPGWRIYPAQVVDGGFLQGLGLHLTARAQGFESDSAVWQALQSNPNYVLIDSSALPYRSDSIINAPVYDPNAPLPADAGSPATPPGFDPALTFSLSGVYQGDSTFPATPLWITNTQQPAAQKFTVIGVVDNSDNAHFGVYIPAAAYKQIPQVTSNTSTPEAQTYYFKVAPGQDKRALALALGSAFLDNGLETTVLEDAIWQVRGPRILLSNVLLGIVGMVLLLGVAALAITGTRAVIERRQQIGMLRALGCTRTQIQGAFLFESFLVGASGSILGVILGLILAKNIFAANFFEQFQTGLQFSVPWEELGLIVCVALLASFLGALLPAWQAGRVAPAEALRYQ